MEPDDYLLAPSESDGEDGAAGEIEGDVTPVVSVNGDQVDAQAGMIPGIGIIANAMNSPTLSCTAADPEGAQPLFLKLPFYDADQGFDANASQTVPLAAKPLAVDVDKYADWLTENANPGYTGHCAKWVRKGLEAGGVDTTGHPADAKNYGPLLTDRGFVEVSPGNLKDYVPQKGDTIVFQPFAGGNPAGHIQAYNGRDWVSDTVQPNFLPDHRYATSQYHIYRPQ